MKGRGSRNQACVVVIVFLVVLNGSIRASTAAETNTTAETTSTTEDPDSTTEMLTKTTEQPSSTTANTPTTDTTELSTLNTTETQKTVGVDPALLTTSELSTTDTTEPPSSISPEQTTENSTETPLSTTPEQPTTNTTEHATEPTTLSLESSTVVTITDPNEMTFYGSVNMGTLCNQSNETTDRNKMHAALTEIFNSTPGFKRLEVSVAICPNTFTLVINRTLSEEAQSNFSMSIHMMLTQQMYITFEGQQYSVDEVTTTDYNKQAAIFTNTSEPCDVFLAIKPCPTGNCIQIGNVLECRNVTATTDTPETPSSTTSEQSTANATEPALSTAPEQSSTNATESALLTTPEQSSTNATESALLTTPEQFSTNATESALLTTPEQSSTNATESALLSTPEQSSTNATESALLTTPEQSSTNATESALLTTTEQPTTNATESDLLTTPEQPTVNTSETVLSTTEQSTTNHSEPSSLTTPEQPTTNVSELVLSTTPEQSTTNASESSSITTPEQPTTNVTESDLLTTPEQPTVNTSEALLSTTEQSTTNHSEPFSLTTPEQPTTNVSELVLSTTPEQSTTNASESSSITTPEQPTTNVTESLSSITPEQLTTNTTEPALSATSEQPTTNATEPSSPTTPEQTTINATESLSSTTPEQPTTNSTTSEQTTKNATEPSSPTTPEQLTANATEPPSSTTPEQPITNATEHFLSTTPEQSTLNATEPFSLTTPEQLTTNATEPALSTTPEQPTTNNTEPASSTIPEPSSINTTEPPSTTSPEQSTTNATEPPSSTTPGQATTKTTEPSLSTSPEQPTTNATEPSSSTTPTQPKTNMTEPPSSTTPEQPMTNATEPSSSTTTTQPTTNMTEPPSSTTPEQPTTNATEFSSSTTPEQSTINMTEPPSSTTPEQPTTNATEPSSSTTPTQPKTNMTEPPSSTTREQPTTNATEFSSSTTPEQPTTNATEPSSSTTPTQPKTNMTEPPSSTTPEQPSTNATEPSSSTTPTQPTTNITEPPSSTTPEQPTTNATEFSSSTTPEQPTTNASEPSSSTTPTQPTTNLTESPSSTTPEQPTINATEPASSTTPYQPKTNTSEPSSLTTPETLTINSTESPSPTTPQQPTTNTTESPSSVTPEPPATNTTESSTSGYTTDPNEMTFSGSVYINALCDQSNGSTTRTKMHAALTEIFSSTPGFKRLEVSVAICPNINTSFIIVVDKTFGKEAKSNISLTIHVMLNQQLNITFDGLQYTVDEVTVTDYNGQTAKFTSTSYPCEIFTAIEPCANGDCTQVGNDLKCMNVTATTDMTTSSEFITTTEPPMTTYTEPPSTTTLNDSSISTEPSTTITFYNATSSTVTPTQITADDNATSSTVAPTKITVEDNATISTRAPSPITTDNLTTSTEPPTPITTSSTTFAELPTITADNATISTELPTTATADGSTISTEPSTSTTIDVATSSTEPRITTIFDTVPSTTITYDTKPSTESTSTTTTYNITTSTKSPSTSSTFVSITSSEPLTTTVADGLTTSTELLSTTLSYDSTTSSEQSTTSAYNLTSTESLISTAEDGSTTESPTTTIGSPTTSTTESLTTSTTESPTTSTTESLTATTTESATTSSTESATASTTQSPATSTTESSTTSITESSTTSTTESPTSTTESPTTSSTESSTTSTTESSTTSTTESSTTSTTESSTTSTTESPTTSTTESPTSTTESSTTSTTESSTTSTTESPTTSTTESPTSTTESPTSTTESSTTSTTESSTTSSTESSTTSSTESLTTSTTEIETTTTTELSTTPTTQLPTTTTTSTTQPPTTTPTTQPPTTTTTQAVTTTTTTQTPPTREPAVNEPLPFGSTEDFSITGDDVTSERLTSPMTLQIGDGTTSGFNYVVIGTNGIIGLGERYNSFSIEDLNRLETFNRRIICPFWVDLVAEGGLNSAVYYNVYKRENQNDAAILNRVDKIIQTFFDDFKSFKSSIVYKVTWYNMTFFTDRTKRVTFQSLIVSDGLETFSVTNYIDVNVPSTFGTRISMGYRYRQFVESNTYSNRPASFRMTEVYGNTGQKGLWVTKLTTETTVNPQEIECYNWYAVQSQRWIPNPWWLTCPCNGFALRFFGFRFTYHRYDRENNVICYVSITYGPSLECCYRRWGFRFRPGPLSSRIPEAGSVLSANPFFQPIDYYQDNSRAKEVCCASGHCDWYYNLRPRPRFCLRLIPVRTAWFFGDPHINTLDGGKYTFNGYGEYTMMKIDNNGTEFDLQARTDLATNANGTTINATIFSAFVAKDQTGSIVQVEMSRNKKNMYVRGNGRDLTLEFENNPEYIFRTVNISISMDNGTIEASFIQSAITIKISLGVRFLTSETMVDEKYRGKVTGLMGNFDGNTTNDFILPNGTTLYGSDVDTERKIYNNFGKLWSINVTTSLFHYDTGLTHDDYSHPEFVPFFIDEFPEDKRNKSIEVCGGAKATQACIFDFLATGDQSLAEASGADDDTSATDTASLENEIPSIEGDNNIKAEVNKSVEIKFNATDDESYTYEILQQPPGFSFNNTTGIATWTPQDNNVANISVTVVDNKGEQAAPVDVAIILCSGCNGRGNCSYNNTRSSTSDMFKYAECECDVGYSGQDCENDTDWCAQSPCAQGRNCTDLTPEEERLRGRGYNCSDCPAGYFLDVDKCEDKNECNSTTTNTCDSTSQDCENTEGSYQCNCKTGFRKVGDTCQDIDECIESTSGCEQSCTNSPGSFVCSCVTGFKLNSDNKSCNGSSNCIGLNCEYACSNSTGSDTCICQTGYKLKDKENCTDINECEVGGFCSQDCQNSVGTYTCSCFSGFSLNPDKTTCSACEPPSYGVDCKETCRCGKGMDRCDPVTGCVCKENWTGSNCDQDVNECTENPNICGSDKTCVNLEGGYTCNCRAGYKKDSQGNCIDINECDNAASNNCSTETTTCSNNNGSYTCACKPGYTRKKLYECEDFDECNAGTDGCTQKCVNVDGSFNCECEFGYTLGDDRKTCIEVQDICSLFPSLNCTYGCKKNDTVGYCFCAAGYLLNAQDKRSCVDVDECNDVTLNQCNFKEKCVNIGGSYNCSCPTGYTLENDGRTCKECNGFTYGEDCKTPCNCGVGSSRCDNVRGCICLDGWTGEKCDIDKDECAPGSHCTKTNQECKNTPGSFQCVCATGYEKNSTTEECSDIDECQTNPCGQVCTNTPGSYSCSCNAGFRLVGTSQCEDYDECSAPTSPCDQICTNTQGSFRCSCNPGFSLNVTTRTTCETRTLCQNATFKCSQKCGVNRDGSEYCFCDPGFSLNDDGVNCTDIDECSPNPCSENCTQNAPGAGYFCSCAPGKRLDVDQRTCIDCDSQKYGSKCASNCTCDVQNTLSCDKVNGSCTCKTGWKGANCSIDVDECSNKTVCPTNSNCLNTNGSFSCICFPGYVLASGKCLECTSTTYGQDCANQCTCDITNSKSCDKQNGTCYCNDGWTGVNCTEDIRECDNNQNICGANANCSEVPGSYLCNCHPGYKKNANGVCEDIDECVLGRDTCNTNANCTNIVGSFSCTCKAGFSGDGSSCTPCNSTHFGEGCSSVCSCKEANTLDCDDVTGRCTCLTGWTGADCGTDIDECAAKTDNCTADIHTCINVDGLWDCACKYGNSSSECIVKEAEYTPVTNEVKVGVVVTFKETLSLSDYNATKMEMMTALTSYYKRKIEGFIKVVILVIRHGSTIVEHEIVTNKSDKAQQDTALAVVSLSKGEDKVEYSTQNLSTASVAVVDKDGNVKNITSSSSRCDIYVINNQCQSGEQCIENENKAYCSKISDDYDEFKLIVGLGVGIPLFFIAVLILAIVCVYWRRHREDDSSSLSEDEFGNAYGGYFPSVIPTKIDSWGKHMSPYSPHYLSDHSTVQGGNRYDDVTYGREPYMYDNGEKSNFSWDFMYQTLAPNEKFQIKRPGIRSQPLNTE